MRIGARFISSLLTVSLCLSSCQQCREISPCITYTPQKEHIRQLPSPFPSLSIQEQAEPWAKELMVAEVFAEELDLYRAITTYKRALILMPKNLKNRRRQAEYSILFAYYLGKKYAEVIDSFEKSDLVDVTEDFPAFDQLLLILEDSYRQQTEEEVADHLLQVIEEDSEERAISLKLLDSFLEGNCSRIKELSLRHPNQELIESRLYCYQAEAFSPEMARNLSFFPGAGYWYVGQKKSAVTSFLINTLFTWAAVRFFERGHIAAGVITTGFEAGWYFGGINGASLAAVEYNERVYECHAKEAMIQAKIFPVLLFTKGF